MSWIASLPLTEKVHTFMYGMIAQHKVHGFMFHTGLHYCYMAMLFIEEDTQILLTIMSLLQGCICKCLHEMVI